MGTKKIYTMKHKFVTLLLCFCMIIFTIHAREIRNSNSKNNNNNKNILLRKNNVIHNDMMELKALNAEHLRLQEEAKLSLTPCKVCTYIVEKVKENHNKIPHDMCGQILKEAGFDVGTMSFDICQMIEDAIRNAIPDMRHWINSGCIRKDGISIENIKPCPSAEMCSQLSDLSGKGFCKPPKSHETKTDKCTACKFVMERVKQGYGEQGTLQDICIEAANHGHKELQPYCEMVLNSFLKWGTKYKDWLEKGCKQEEEDGEEEMMTPCPNEYMCHQLEDLSDKPFCPKPKLDKIK